MLIKHHELEKKSIEQRCWYNRFKEHFDKVGVLKQVGKVHANIVKLKE